jgi:hypothetical protein
MKFNNNNNNSNSRDERLKRQILSMSGESNEWVQDRLVEKTNRKVEKQQFKKKKMRYDDDD